MVEPTEAQQELNLRAIEAVNRGELPQAIELFKASLALGELNITYLNMGRTYQRMGECVRARLAFEQALRHPRQVQEPSAEEVSRAALSYGDELQKSCPNGELVVVCEPGQTRVQVEGRAEVTCPGEGAPMRLEEGRYQVTFRSPDGEVRQDRVEVKRLEQVRSSFTASQRASLTPLQTPSSGGDVGAVVPTREGEGRRRVAAALIGVGAATVLMGALWDTCFIAGQVNGGGPPFCAHTHDGKLEARDVIPVVFYGVGAGLIVGGVWRF